MYQMCHLQWCLDRLSDSRHHILMQSFNFKRLTVHQIFSHMSSCIATGVIECVVPHGLTIYLLACSARCITCSWQYMKHTIDIVGELQTYHRIHLYMVVAM